MHVIMNVDKWIEKYQAKLEKNATINANGNCLLWRGQQPVMTKYPALRVQLPGICEGTKWKMNLHCLAYMVGAMVANVDSLLSKVKGVVTVLTCAIIQHASMQTISSWNQHPECQLDLVIR